MTRVFFKTNPPNERTKDVESTSKVRGIGGENTFPLCLFTKVKQHHLEDGELRLMEPL